MQCAFKESMIHQILQFILHFRILPRSSSLREPRGPSLKGVFCLMHFALVTLVSKSKGWCEKKKDEASGAKLNSEEENSNFNELGSLTQSEKRLRTRHSAQLRTDRTILREVTQGQL